MANAQTAFAMSREGMVEPSDRDRSSLTAARRVARARRKTGLSGPPRRRRSPWRARATFASASASKASRAHRRRARERREKASSKKSRLANAQLDAATSRAESRGGVVLREGILRAYRDTRDVVSAAKGRRFGEGVGTAALRTRWSPSVRLRQSAGPDAHAARVERRRRFAADDANVSTVRAMSSAKETFILAFVADVAFVVVFAVVFKSPFSGLLRVSRGRRRRPAAFASSWGSSRRLRLRAARRASASYNSGSPSPELAERPAAFAASCALHSRARRHAFASGDQSARRV